jgi:hypothetical protein
MARDSHLFYPRLNRVPTEVLSWPKPFFPTNFEKSFTLVANAQALKVALPRTQDLSRTARPSPRPVRPQDRRPLGGSPIEMSRGCGKTRF